MFQPAVRTGFASFSVSTWSLLVLLAGAGGATGLLVTRTAAPEPGTTLAADTVTLYGPVTFATPTGAPQYHVEQFTSAVPAEAYQAIRITNGQPDGTGRVSSLSLKLNGQELITAAFDQTVDAREIPVTFLADNTLEVTAAGQAGAQVSARAVAVLSPILTVYGPTRFTRQAGPPQTITEHFSRPASWDPPNTFRILNGNPDGTNRVSAGTVTLNGTDLGVQSDFNQQVGEIVRDVTLLADNELAVRLTSAPGSFIEIDITCVGGVPPVVHIATPAPGAATAADQISVTGTVNAATEVMVTVNGQAATVGAGNTFDRER